MELGMLKSSRLTPQTYWLLFFVLIAPLLSSCKRSEPIDERPCSETVKITKRHGVDVVQSVNGLYLRASIAKDWSCGRDPATRHLIERSRFMFWWYEGKLHTYALNSQAPAVNLPVIVFSDEPTRQRSRESIGYQDWWYTPSIPHKRYPLNLLPNMGVEGGPDPQAGIGTLKHSPAIWAVRGTVDPYNGKPFTTGCSMKPPPDWDGKDHRPEATKALDPQWLIQAETYIKDLSFNTCRGGVSADNGKGIDGMIDVAGAAVPDIDKIYKLVSKWLSDLVVE
jgi:hypothetical protein